MKKHSKILILILSVALICTGLVLAVSADAGTPGASWIDANGETQTEETLDAALASAPEGTTVTLTGDTAVTETVTLSKSATLDLNGYTLTCGEVTLFSADANVSFDIVGTGEIKVDGALVRIPEENVADFSVKGSGKGISIDHNGSKDPNLSCAKAGVIEFKNVDITATPNKEVAISSNPGGTLTYELTGVTVDTTGSTSVDNNSGVFYIAKNGHLNIKQSTILTNGNAINIESQSATVENFIVIEDSYIRASNPKTDTGIFGSYAVLASDILVKNSYIEGSNRPVMLNNSINGASIVLDNSTMHHNGERGNQISRSCSITLKNGSKLTAMNNNISLFHDFYNTTKKQYEGFAASPVYYYLTEGSRLGEYVYNRIVNTDKIELKDGTEILASRYSQEYVRFVEVDESGAETYVKPSESVKLTIAYDPVGDPGAPYVVTAVTETAPVLFTTTEEGEITLNTIGNLSAAGQGIEGLVKYSIDASDHKFYNQTNLSYGSVGINGDFAFRYALNGKTNNAAPNFFWRMDTAIHKQASVCPVDVIVYDFDLATSSEEGFVPGSISLHNRQTSGDSGNEAVNLVAISESGLVTVTSSSPIEKGTDTYQLDANAWNHVTIVIETKSSTGSAFVFINGTYIARVSAMGDSNSDKATYLFGPRYNSDVRTGHALAADTTRNVLIDNVLFRTFGTGSYEASPMTADAAGAYLIDGGAAMRTDSPRPGSVGDITVGGISFDNLNDAIVKANELGIAASVNADLTVAQKVTVAGVVKANGHAIPLTADSLGAKISVDENGAVEVYEFDEKYNETTATVKWFIGNYHDAAQLASDDYYIIETLKMGHLPIYTGEKLGYDYYKEGNVFYVASRVTGWSDKYGKDTLPEAIAPIMEDGAGKTYSFYPTYEDYKKSTARYIILNSAGLYSREWVSTYSSTQVFGSDWWNASNRINTYGINHSIALQYGETFVLCKSDMTFVGNFSSPRTANGEDKVFNIDLNGHTMNIRAEKNTTGKSPTYFQVSKNESMNLYSSVEGAEINIYGMTTDDATTMTGGTLFRVNGSGKNTIEDNIAEDTNNDAHLTVGTVSRFGETYPGSNLTINGDTLVDLNNGDKTCTVAIDGITFVKTIHKYGAVIINRYFNGDVEVTNSQFFIPNGGTFIDGQSGGMKDVTGDGKKDKNDVLSADCMRVAATARIDSCYILTASNGTNDAKGNLSAGDYTFETILYTNCVTNGRIGGSNIGLAIRIGDGCLVYNAAANKADGIVAQLYNKDMTIGNTALETVTVKYVKDFTKVNDSNSNITFNTVEFTYAVPTAEATNASLVLPHFEKKYVSEENTVSVTYTDLATAQETTVKYAKGGNVVIAATSFDGNVIKLTHKGTWNVNGVEGSALPTDIQADAVIRPEFDTDVALSGMKTNLSLYSDFLVNLYIPDTYAQYITAINAKDPAAGTVSIGGASYIKAIVAKNASEASDDAVFEIALKEGEYSTIKLVSVSVTDYASKLLAGGDKFADTDKALMYYMLSYVNEAAKYFGGAENTEVKALLDANTQWNVISVEKTFGNAVAQTGLESIFKSAGIVLNEAPAFTLTFGKAFTGKVTVTYGTGSARVFENLTAEAGTKLVIEDMKIYNFATNLTVTVEPTEGDTVTGTINLDTYAKYHTENAANAESATKAESEAALDLINALYDYVKVAEQYKGGTLTLPEAGNGSEETPAE